MSDRLADIKAREQAAFGGPWEVLDADENGMHAVAVDGTVLVEVGDFCDAEFIAHARDDIPHLLALVESLTADRVEALADAADDTDGEHSHRPYDGVDWDCGQCWVCEVRDALRITASLAGLAAEERDMWRGRAERARAVVARVEALADEDCDRPGCDAANPECVRARTLRAALAEPTGQDHRCSPYWSRSICGGCGGQEANCDKCGRLMCCEPTGQEGDQ